MALSNRTTDQTFLRSPQAAAAEAAAHRRQEAEWARQKEAQRKRDSGQTAREAELQRQKEQYQRELERRMAMERNEAAEMKQKAARDAANARAAAKRKEDEKLRSSSVTFKVLHHCLWLLSVAMQQWLHCL